MKKLKIFFSLFLVSVLTLTSSFVSAAPSVIGNMKFKVEENVLNNPWYMFKKKNTQPTQWDTHVTSRYENIDIIRSQNGDIVYCIEPFCPIDKTGAYPEYDPVDVYEATGFLVTEAQWEEAAAYAAFGYGNNGRDSAEWYAATQYHVWKSVRPDLKEYGNMHFVQFISKGVYNPTSHFDSYINTLQTEVDDFIKNPSVSQDMGREMIISKVYEYTDEAFLGYSVKEAVNCDAWFEGNTLKVRAKTIGDVKVVISKSYGHYGHNARLYADAGRQNLLLAGNCEKKYTLTGYAVGGKVRIEKQDEETGARAQGDATLVGAQYNLCKEDGTYIETLTIGDDRKAESRYLPLGRYYLTEIGAPTGYNLKSDKIYFDITEEVCRNVYLDLTCPEPVITGSIEIYKKLGETDYDSEIPLSGAKFTATLVSSNGTKVYESNVSGEDGICTITNLPYGLYEIEEVQVPNSAYKIDNFTVMIEEQGKTYKFTKVDVPKMMKIEVQKELIEQAFKGDAKRTDAVTLGAEFTVYTDPSCAKGTEYKDKNNNTVVIGPTDEAGYAISKKMRTGNYYLKETVFPKGINGEAYIPGENIKYKDKVYRVECDPAEQLDPGNKNYTVITPRINAKNQPISGKVKVRKRNDDLGNTTGFPAAGAQLKLTLKSTIGKGEDEIAYYATVQSDGTAEFIYPEMWDLDFGNTILYGEYVLSEVGMPGEIEDYYFFIEPEQVIINEEAEEEYRIVSDDTPTPFIELRKVDADTSKDVNLEGFKFKIYRLASDNNSAGWVTQFDSESNTYIDEFVSGKNGRIITPEKVEAGEYIVYEVDAPEGYFIDPKLRIPEDESQYGNKENGVYKNVTNVASGVLPGSDPSQAEDGYMVTIEVKDEPLVGKIEILKTGLMFTDVSEEGTDYSETLYKAEYSQRPLPGVVYDVYAAEDIKYPDGTGNYVEKGRKVDTITTLDNGVGTSKELYPGKYELIEVSTPAGILVTGERIPVEVVNNDKYNRVSINHYDLTNDRQKLEIKINKKFEATQYSVDESFEKLAIFGVFSKETIKTYDNSAEIPQDGLVALVEFNETGSKVDEMNLPAGKYYVRELYASEMYVMSDEIKEVELIPDTSSKPVLTFNAGEFTNTPITRDLYMMKFSASSVGAANQIGMTGTTLNKDLVETEIADFVSEINQLTLDQIKQKVEQKQWLTVDGAEYTIYEDEECTKPVKYNATGEEVKVNSKISGFYEVTGLPIGTYYIKETKTPVYVDGDKEVPYVVDAEPVKITLKEEENLAGSLAFRALWNEAAIGKTIEKKDAFTSDPVANCTFEILDSSKKVIYHSTTDISGEAGIPIDILKQGETYYFHEIDAPDLYKEKGEVLNTDYHEFVANYKIVDGRVVFDEVKKIENSRFSRDVKVKKIDEKTGKPLPGCKFSIVLLDEEGNEYVNQEGETVYAIKDAVTDENGECLIEKVPAGSYRFIEVEAPEGYDLAEQKLEGLEFTINKDTPRVLEFEVTNTGDVAVYVLSAIAVISILGIVLVIARKRKLVR